MTVTAEELNDLCNALWQNSDMKKQIKVTLTLEVADKLPFEHAGEPVDEVQYLIEHYGTNIPCMGFPVEHGEGWEIARVRDTTVEVVE